MTFENIKRNFDRKLWNEKMVAVAVKKGLITPEQYRIITKQEFVG